MGHGHLGWPWRSKVKVTMHALWAHMRSFLSVCPSACLSLHQNSDQRIIHILESIAASTCFQRACQSQVFFKKAGGLTSTSSCFIFQLTLKLALQEINKAWSYLRCQHLSWNGFDQWWCNSDSGIRTGIGIPEIFRAYGIGIEIESKAKITKLESKFLGIGIELSLYFHPRSSILPHHAHLKIMWKTYPPCNEKRNFNLEQPYNCRRVI